MKGEKRVVADLSRSNLQHVVGTVRSRRSSNASAGTEEGNNLLRKEFG